MGLVGVDARRTAGAPMVPEHTPLRGTGVAKNSEIHVSTRGSVVIHGLHCQLTSRRDFKLVSPLPQPNAVVRFHFDSKVMNPHIFDFGFPILWNRITSSRLKPLVKRGKKKKLATKSIDEKAKQYESLPEESAYCEEEMTSDDDEFEESGEDDSKEGFEEEQDELIGEDEKTQVGNVVRDPYDNNNDMHSQEHEGEYVPENEPVERKNTNTIEDHRGPPIKTEPTPRSPTIGKRKTKPSPISPTIGTGKTEPTLQNLSIGESIDLFRQYGKTYGAELQNQNQKGISIKPLFLPQFDVVIPNHKLLSLVRSSLSPIRLIASVSCSGRPPRTLSALVSPSLSLSLSVINSRRTLSQNLSDILSKYRKLD
ncbi:hypothetical protein Sjap_020224 [Stephania japonica]|uniref:Uncharacterized protein n=1 Tax=Stephania japonica TaxID=461633 RepID=A0AAP0F092_9MAGN